MGEPTALTTEEKLEFRELQLKELYLINQIQQMTSALKAIQFSLNEKIANLSKKGFSFNPETLEIKPL